MLTMTKRRYIAVALAAGLILSACGSGDDDSTASGGVASLSEAAADSGDGSTGGDDDSNDGVDRGADGGAGDEASSSEGGATTSDDPELAFARYDECMADAGFDFGSSLVSPDDADASGAVMIQEFEPGDDADPQQLGPDGFDFGEEFASADKECSKHLEGLDLSFDMSPEEQAAMEDAQLAWTECMRENGIDVPDFDPSSGGVTIIGGSEDPSDPQAGSIDDSDFDFEAFEEANKACEQVFEDLLGDTVFAEGSES